jgi:hypothetical protein
MGRRRLEGDMVWIEFQLDRDLARRIDEVMGNSHRRGVFMRAAALTELLLLEGAKRKADRDALKAGPPAEG